MSKMTAESAENMASTPLECIENSQNEGTIHHINITSSVSYNENVGMYREMRNCE